MQIKSGLLSADSNFSGNNCRIFFCGLNLKFELLLQSGGLKFDSKHFYATL